MADPNRSANRAGAPFVPATDLEDAIDAATEDPLASDDPRYVDLTAARGENPMTRVERRLKRAVGRGDAPLVVLTGHKGVGKSTELLRLEDRLRRSDAAYPVFLPIDQSLLEQGDVSLVILWLSDRLARHFAEAGMPLPDDRVAAVAEWFAERSDISIEREAVEASAAVSTEARAGLAGFGFGVKALARLTSALRGSSETRAEVTRRLRDYAEDLIGYFNMLLSAARTVLENRDDAPGGLVLIIDDLDKFRTPSVARSFFFDSGRLLEGVQLPCVLTAPIDIILAPEPVARAFGIHEMLKTPCPHDRSGAPAAGVIDGLRQLATCRMDLDAVFDGAAPLDRLIRACGGNPRELMRLIGYAADAALDEEADKIGPAHADQAVKRIRLDYERVLVPRADYFPYLARVHRTKGDGVGETEGATRDLLARLLLNGAVMEYNGDNTWYDVHPAIRESRPFQEATTALDDGAAAGGAA